MPELGRCLADDEQRGLNGKAYLLVILEALTIEPDRESFDARDIIQNVLKRCIGSLEGTQCLSLHASMHARFQRPFLDQVHRLTKQFGKLVFNVDNVKQGKIAAFVECGHQVDIRVQAAVSTRGGAKQGQSHHAGSAKRLLVCLQSGYDLFPLHFFILPIAVHAVKAERARV